MNASDMLKYGHLTLLNAIEKIPREACETNRVCGVWSVKEIIAHLASFEHVLVEVCNQMTGGETGPILKLFQEVDGDQFNAIQVGQRKQTIPTAVLDEYITTQAKTMACIAQITAETLRQPGSLPWYGLEYSLDDFIVYTFYGHKREHMAQVAVFRDRIRR